MCRHMEFWRTKISLLVVKQKDVIILNTLSCVTYISKILMIILKIRFKLCIILQFLIKLLVSKSLISFTHPSQFYFHLAIGKCYFWALCATLDCVKEGQEKNS